MSTKSYADSGIWLMRDDGYEEIRTPQQNTSDDSARIVEWHMERGSQVVVGDLVATLETSKCAFEIESPATGFLFYSRAAGEDLLVGELLAVVAKTEGFSPEAVDWTAGSPASKSEEAPETAGVRFSKGALALIEEYSLDRRAFADSGMVRKRDVLDHLEQRGESGTAGEPVAAREMAGEQGLMILGGGGHARMCIDILRQMGTYRIHGIVDPNLELGSTVMGVPVLGNDDDLGRLRKQEVRLAVLGIGAVTEHPRRDELFRRLKSAGFSIPNLIHPSACIEPSATLGEGNQIMAHATVGSAVRIYDNSIINSGSVVSHDSILGDNVHVAPGAILAGGVRVGRNTLIGMGVTVYLGVEIGENVTIFNGCRVNRDVPDNTVVRENRD